MRIVLAFRLFFRALWDRATAERLQRALASTSSPESTAETKSPTAIQPPKRPTAARSDALTLLAALQREARFVDIVQEPLASYSDAQIGAAARQVLTDCASVLQRMFQLEPVLSQEEGSEVQVPDGYDPQQYKLSGNVSGTPPYHGRLVHHGWAAQRCDLPAWSGTAEVARIIAPVEVELP